MASISGEKRQHRLRPIASGPGQSNSERRIGNDQPWNLEQSAVIRRKILKNESGANIERSVGEKRSVEGMAEWIGGVGRGQ
jgi:hypothetical protein